MRSPSRTDSMAMTQANDQPTTINTVSCICGKQCKNDRGLKIHMAKMRCREREHEEQCTGSSPGETQEEPGRWVTPQSPEPPSPPAPVHFTSQRREIRWPPATGGGREREKTRKRTVFSSNPFRFVKLLGEKRSGHLSCSPEVID